MFAKDRDRWDEALRDLHRAHQLNPNDVHALSGLGWAEVAAGSLESGVAYLRLALRTNPRDPDQYSTHFYLAQAQFLAGDYASAIDYAVLAITDAPEFAGGYIILAASEVGLRNLERAVSALDRARRIAPEFLQSRLDGAALFRNPEHIKRFTNVDGQSTYFMSANRSKRSVAVDREHAEVCIRGQHARR